MEAQQQTTSALREELEALNEKHEVFVSDASTAADSLRAALREKDALVHSLEEELNRRPTTEAMEAMEAQLRIFQTVEYNADADDSVRASAADSVENLLIKKNRHLEHQLTIEKRKQVLR